MTVDARKTRRHATPGRARKTFPGAPSTTTAGDGAIAYFDENNDLQGATLAFITSASNILLSVAAELRFRSDATSYRIYSPSAASLNIEGSIRVKVGTAGADVTLGPGTGAALAIRPDNTTTADDVDVGTSALPMRNGWFDGQVWQQPGNAASTWAGFGGLVYTDATDHATAGGVGMTSVDQDMATVSLPANLLATDNDTLLVVASGITAATGNTKIIKLIYGASTVVSITGGFNNVSWQLFGTITRTGATAQRCDGQAHASTFSNTNYVLGGETLSGAVTLKTTGSSNAGSPVPASEVTTKKLQYFWYPGQ